MKKLQPKLTQVDKLKKAFRKGNKRGKAGVTRRKTVPQRLGKKLAAIRLRHGLSQTEMLLIANPNEVEENRARVSQWERDVRTPSLIEVLNYARYAKISVEMLIDDEFDLPQQYENYMS